MPIRVEAINPRDFLNWVKSFSLGSLK
jgi:hypothetical protein